MRGYRPPLSLSDKPTPLIPGYNTPHSGMQRLLARLPKNPALQTMARLTPEVEQPIVEDMLYNQLGANAPRYFQVERNSVEMIQAWRLPLGAMPTPEQIASLTKPIVLPVYTTVDPSNPDVVALLPVLFLDKESLATARSSAGNVIRGNRIDLDVQGDVKIQGTIESMTDHLRIYARHIAHQGKLKSAGDIDLLADEDLLIETLVEEVTSLHPSAKIEAGGQAKLKGKKKFESLGAEVVGKRIVAQSDVDVIIIPKKLLKDLKAELAKNFNDERRKMFCEEFVANYWTGEQSIEITALGNLKMAGGRFFAKDLLSLEATQGNLETLEFHQFCKEELKDGEVKTATSIKTEFASDSRIKTHSGKDTKLTNIGAKADAIDINAGGNVDIKGGRSAQETKTSKYENHFFSWGKDGLFYFWGAETSHLYDYEEAIDMSTLDGANINVNAGGKIDWAGTNLRASKTGSLTAEGDITIGDMDVAHSTQSSESQAGFAFGYTLNAGEASASIGVGVRRNSEDHKKGDKVVSTLEGEEKLILKSAKGNVKGHGTVLRGNVFLAGRNVTLVGSNAEICFEGNLFEGHAGIKAGVKSRLLKALSNTLGIAASKVEVWEDGVNIGFRALQNALEVATGLLVPPIEGGIWFTAKAAYNKKGNCYQIVYLPKIEADHFDVSAEQCIDLRGAKIVAESGRFSGQKLDIGAEDQHSSMHQTSVNGEIDILLQGAGASSVNIQGSQSTSSTNEKVNADIKVAGKLEFDISGAARIRGANIEAGELVGDFGDLLVESLKSDMQARAYGGSLSLDPKGFESIKTLFTGGGAQTQGKTKTWLSSITSLVGIDSAKIVVRKTLHLVGAIVANAQKNPDNTLTDKGKLLLQTARLITESVETADDGLLLGLDISRGPNKAFAATVGIDFGYTNLDGTTEAGIGGGDIRITSDDAASQEAAANVNRNLNNLQHESGVDISPLHFYVPVPDFNNPRLIVEFAEEVLETLKNPGHKFYTGYSRIMQGMTWFVADPEAWRPFESPRLKNLYERLEVIGDKAKAEGDTKTQNEIEAAKEQIRQADDIGELAKNIEDPALKRVLDTQRERQIARADRLSKRAEKGSAKSPLIEELKDLNQAANLHNLFAQKPWAQDALNSLEARARDEQAKGNTDEAFAALDEAWRFVDIVRGVKKGAWNEVKSYGEFLTSIAKDPTGSSIRIVQGMTNIKAIRAAVQEYLETSILGFAELDAEDKGEVIGQLAMTAAMSVAMGGILGAGAKLAKQVKALLKGANRVDEIVEASKKWSRAPKNLQDELTLKAAQRGEGAPIIGSLNDPRFIGMEKWQLKVKSAQGKTSVVHYVKDPKTGTLLDFKFKKHSVD